MVLKQFDFLFFKSWNRVRTRHFFYRIFSNKLIFFSSLKGHSNTSNHIIEHANTLDRNANTSHHTTHDAHLHVLCVGRVSLLAELGREFYWICRPQRIALITIIIVVFHWGRIESQKNLLFHKFILRHTQINIGHNYFDYGHHQHAATTSFGLQFGLVRIVDFTSQTIQSRSFERIAQPCKCQYIGNDRRGQSDRSRQRGLAQ